MLKPILYRAITVALLAGFAGSAAAAAEAPQSGLAPPERFAWAPADASVAPNTEAEFWRGFGDAQLTALVERALHENHDLRIALAHFESANALLRSARLDRFPTVTAQANASDSRLSTDQAALAGGNRTSKSYDVGAQLSWELDLFGRVRNNVHAQRADTDATASDLQAMQVAIVAEVARDYFQLRGLQEQSRVAQENADSQAETLRLVEAGLDAGRGTDFDTARARAQLSSTSARVPALQAEIAARMHHLSVLTGQLPEALGADLTESTALPALPAGVDPGTPGDLLLRRPDVAAAQARLAAATARIGVAKADLFPRFTLGGLIGTQAVHSGDLFAHDSDTHLVALGIDWSFLDFGRVRARLAAAHANADGELAAYEQVVLRALEETENALVRFDKARSEDEQLVRAAVDSAQAAKLARVRYEAGAVGLFEVLDAERSNLQAQDAAAQSRARGFSDLIAVYQALAGGWPAQLPQSKRIVSIAHVQSLPSSDDRTD
jgi:NodT family efflux transporter outer membrane factor (OMF) lipoprotein